MDLTLFISLNAVNILTAMMFFSRTNLPVLSSVFGFLTILMAVPLTVVGIFNKINNNHFLSWIPAFIFTAWAILAIFVDYVFKIEFRNPVNIFLLTIFLVLFYLPIIGLGIYIFKINKPFWYFTIGTTALNLIATVYAHINGKG